MAEWAALCHVLEVCDRDTGYKGGREAPGAVVAEKGGYKAAEFYVKKYFGDGKVAASEI